MKPKLTKAKLKRAKRVVVADLRLGLTRGVIGTLTGGWCESDYDEWPEVERLLRVALKAVRGA